MIRYLHDSSTKDPVPIDSVLTSPWMKLPHQWHSDNETYQEPASAQTCKVSTQSFVLVSNTCFITARLVQNFRSGIYRVQNLIVSTWLLTCSDLLHSLSRLPRASSSIPIHPTSVNTWRLGSFMMARKLCFVICKNAWYVSISWAWYDRCIWYSRECIRNWIYGHTKRRDEKTK